MKPAFFLVALLTLGHTVTAQSDSDTTTRKTMDIQKEIIVNKPIAEVWDLLGNRYGEGYKWARGLYHSEAQGSPVIEGAMCSNRSCETSFGHLNEEIRVFKPNEQLSYEVVEGFPGFIKKGVNNWYLTKVSETETRVSMRFEGETQGFAGVIMGPMMKMNLGKGLEGALFDFKHYVETGKPSPEKVKDQEKYLKKQKQAA